MSSVPHGSGYQQFSAAIHFPYGAFRRQIRDWERVKGWGAACDSGDNAGNTQELPHWAGRLHAHFPCLNSFQQYQSMIGVDMARYRWVVINSNKPLLIGFCICLYSCYLRKSHGGSCAKASRMLIAWRFPNYSVFVSNPRGITMEDLVSIRKWKRKWSISEWYSLTLHCTFFEGEAPRIGFQRGAFSRVDLSSIRKPIRMFATERDDPPCWCWVFSVPFHERHRGILDCRILSQT